MKRSQTSTEKSLSVVGYERALMRRYAADTPLAESNRRSFLRSFIAAKICEDIFDLVPEDQKLPSLMHGTGQAQIREQTTHPIEPPELAVEFLWLPKFSIHQTQRVSQALVKTFKIMPHNQPPAAGYTLFRTSGDVDKNMVLPPILEQHIKNVEDPEDLPARRIESEEKVLLGLRIVRQSMDNSLQRCEQLWTDNV